MENGPFVGTKRGIRIALKGVKLMIIKKISCNVKDEDKDLFYEHQKQWSSLSTMKGFLGQIGGWCTTPTYRLVACIYSFWDNSTNYNRFMEEHHDRIFKDLGQKKTYESININLFQDVIDIPGIENNIINILKRSNYIRISISIVKEDKIHHFVDTQKNVWNSGMQKSEGMIGGTFGSSLKTKNEFLVFTGWRRELYHQKYMNEKFSQLYQKAQPKADVYKITGEQFRVEDCWRVYPSIYS